LTGQNKKVKKVKGHNPKKNAHLFRPNPMGNQGWGGYATSKGERTYTTRLTKKNGGGGGSSFPNKKKKSKKRFGNKTSREPVKKKERRNLQSFRLKKGPAPKQSWVPPDPS